MGILKLACTASDSNFVWGLTITNNYSTPFSYSPEQYYAIVKSNANPTRNAGDLTWSLISAINADIIRPIPATNSEYYCAVNSKGVFTVLYTYISFESLIYFISAPAGFQYDPAAPLSSASYNQTLQIGSGVWSGVTADPAFVWPTYPCKPKLFYAGGNAGSTPSLILAYFDSYLNEGISFALLNESTKTLSFVGSWASLLPSKIESFVYANNQLLVHSFKASSSPLLSIYPLTTVTAVVPVPRTINVSEASSCHNAIFIYTGVVGDSFYLICASMFSEPNTPNYSPTKLYTLANINTNGSYLPPGRILADNLLDMTNWNFSIGSDGMGTAAIALMIGSDHTFILDMSGSGIGITSGPANITIPETLGTDPSPKSYSSSSSFSSGSIVGLTLGLICGVVLLVGLAFFVRRKRNSRSQKGPTPTNQAMPLATTRDYTQGISIPSAGTKYNVRPAHVPETSAPAVTSIGAGNADAGQFPRNHFSVQQLRFSSHPRPNFVTTLGGDGADNSVQLSEARTRDDTSSPLNSALWSPRPFVPPARSSGADLSLIRDWTGPTVLPTAPQQHSPYSQLDSDFAMRSVSHTASVSPSTSPAVSTHSRLSPQEGSPQAVTSSNSPQYRGD